jgi:biopolymer transport protein TolR
MAKPEINVTPLIDVLLVLLIIFMVVTPMKPSSFEAKIPSEPTATPALPNPDTLVVSVDPDSTLKLNHVGMNATVAEPERLITELSRIFDERERNQAYALNSDGTSTQRFQKTVFIKAPRSLSYGSVAKVVDAVKAGGADPISLQLDGLD